MFVGSSVDHARRSYSFNDAANPVQVSDVSEEQPLISPALSR